MKFAYLIICILFAIQLNAQDIRIFDINTINYPQVKAKILVKNSNGQYVIPDKSSLELKVDDKTVDITHLDNTSQYKEAKYKILIVSNICNPFSESLNNLKQALKQFVRDKRLEFSKIGLVDFRDSMCIVADMTDIDDFDINLIDSLKVSNTANYKEFLNVNNITDAYGDDLITADDVPPLVLYFYDHKNPGLNLYPVSLIWNQKYVEVTAINLYDKEEIMDSGQHYIYCPKDHSSDEIYNMMLKRIILQKNASIQSFTFNMPESCSDVADAVITYLPYSTTDTIKICTKRIYNYISSNSINFGSIEIGETKEQKIVFSSFEDTIKVDDIVATNPLFNIYPRNFILNPSSSIELTISYTQNNNQVEFCEFNVVSNKCFIPKIYARAVKKDTSNNLDEIISCSLKDSLKFGLADTIIVNNVLPDEILMLYYSDDNGISWNSIPCKQIGNKLIWNGIPNVFSDSLLLKVVLSNPINVINRRDINNNYYYPSEFDYSPSLKMFVFANGAKVICVDSLSESIKQQFVTNSGFIQVLKLTKDGNKLILVTNEGVVELWDLINMQILKSMKIEISDYYNLSVNDQYFSISSIGNTHHVYDIDNFNIVKTFNGGIGLNYSAFSNNSTLFCYSSSLDSTISIYNSQNWTLLKTIKETNELPAQIEFSPNDLFLEWISYNKNETQQLRFVFYDIQNDMIVSSYRYSNIYNSIYYDLFPFTENDSEVIEFENGFSSQSSRNYRLNFITNTRTNPIKGDNLNYNLIESKVVNGRMYINALNRIHEINPVTDSVDNYIQISANIKYAKFNPYNNDLLLNSYDSLVVFDNNLKFVRELNPLNHTMGFTVTDSGNTIVGGFYESGIEVYDSQSYLLKSQYQNDSLEDAFRKHYSPNRFSIIRKNAYIYYYDSKLSKHVLYNGLTRTSTFLNIPVNSEVLDLDVNKDGSTVSLFIRNNSEKEFIILKNNLPIWSKKSADLKIGSIRQSDDKEKVLYIENGSLLRMVDLNLNIDKILFSIPDSANSSYITNNCKYIAINDKSQRLILLETDGNNIINIQTLKIGEIFDLVVSEDMKYFAGNLKQDLYSSFSLFEINEAVANYYYLSDKKIKIESPDIHIADIDFANIMCQSIVDTTIATYIRNSSQYPININKIDLVKSEYANGFSIYSDISNSVLAPYSDYPVLIRVYSKFIHEQELTDSIKLQYNDVYITKAFVKANVIPKSLANVLIKNSFDFGKALIGKKVVREIVLLQNNGNNPIYINKILLESDDASFKMISDTSGFTLNSNDNKTISISYEPFSKSKSKAKLKVFLEDSILYPFICNLEGDGVDKIESVSDNSELERLITISPNPSQDYSIIGIDDKVGEIRELYVIDNLGRKLLEINTKDLILGRKLVLNSKELNNGAYTLVCVSSGGTICKKIMIAR